MRRQKAVSVKVDAPSKGLVTRIPSEVTDGVVPLDLRRAYDEAENVRFEDGVVAAAPGYEEVSVTYGSGITNPLASLPNAQTELVGHYKLDELAAASRVNSAGVDSFDVVDQNPESMSGVFDEAVKVTTDQQYLVNEDSLFEMNGKDFTITSWFYMSVDGEMTIVSKGNPNATFDYYVSCSPNGEWVKFVVHDGTTTKTAQVTNVAPDQWNFFAATHVNGTEIRLRVGTVTATIAHTTGVRSSVTEDLYLGREVSWEVGFLAVDSLSIWTRALNETHANLPVADPNEIDRLFNNGSGVDYPFLGKSFSMIHEGELVGETITKPLVLGDEKHLFLATRSYSGDPGQFNATLSQIYYSGTASITPAARWSVTDYFNKLIFATRSLAPLFYESGYALPIPGLASSDKFDGVTAFQNHLLLWRDNTLKWSAKGDMTEWIPVADTVSSHILSLEAAFTQPAVDATSDWIGVTEAPTGLTVGQFLKLADDYAVSVGITGATNAVPIVITTASNHGLSTGDQVTISGVGGNTNANGTFTIVVTAANTFSLDYSQGNAAYTSGGTVTRTAKDYTNYYRVEEVSPVASLTGLLAACGTGGDQSIAAAGESTIILSAYKAWEVGQRLATGAASSQVLVVNEASRDFTDSFALSEAADYNATELKLDGDNTTFAIGDYVSVGDPANPAYDVFEVTGVTVSTTTGSGITTLTVTKQNVGSNIKTSGQYVEGTAVVLAPTLRIQNDGALITFTDSTNTSTTARALTEKCAIKIKGLDYTGRTPADTITKLALDGSTRQFFTMDANDAGETQLVGEDVNSPILQVVPMGDYAFVCKRKSISIVQDVGRDAGTFAFRTLVREEGFLSRYSFIRLSGARMIFLGHQELYDYRGELEAKPVCQQFTRQLLEEVDRTRLDEITFFHNRLRNEVWINYPVAGGEKVLVWNYLEDTATIDRYPSASGGLVAADRVRWVADPIWSDFAADQSWSGLDVSQKWSDLVGVGEEENTVLVCGNGDLVVHGRLFSRKGSAYTASAETKDFDLGDEEAYKYIDTLRLSFDVKQKLVGNRLLYVQIGTRRNLDEDITWSTAQSIDVSGRGQNRWSKLNFRVSGRFIRLKFYSTDKDVPWRISSYTLHARMGNTY